MGYPKSAPRKNGKMDETAENTMEFVAFEVPWMHNPMGNALLQSQNHWFLHKRSISETACCLGLTLTSTMLGCASLRWTLARMN